MTDVTPAYSREAQTQSAAALVLTRPPRHDGNVINRSSVGRQVLVYTLLLLFALLYIYPFLSSSRPPSRPTPTRRRTRCA